MLYSKITLKLHWGFSIVTPSAAKSKPSLYLPPPTTLIGALSYGKFRGQDNFIIDKNMASPAYNLGKIKAAARFCDVGAYIEDIVKNVIIYFQRQGERRLDPKYRYGAIPTGKVYYPNRNLKVVYVVDSIGKEELEKLSWSITRIGCKECFVSVENVEIGEAKPYSGKVKTMFYFPANVKLLKGNVEYINFWDDIAFLWGEEGKKVRYALPITHYPLMSTEAEVEAKESYEVGGEYVVFA